MTDREPIEAEPEGDDAAQVADPAEETRALQAELASLKAQLDEVGQVERERADRPRRGIWRVAVVVVLLMLVTVLAPMSVVSAWANRELGSTDTYVKTVTPLASDPAIQAAITDRVTDEILSYVDVSSLTQTAIDALTARGVKPAVVVTLNALAGPLERAVENFIHDRVAALVSSDAFEEAWIAANRQAHSQLVVALTGEGGDGSVSVSDNAVRINLAALINSVKTQLVDSGFELASKIPTVDATFTVFESDDLGNAQQGFRLLQHLAIVLPLLTLGLWLGAIVIAANRRKTAIAGALCIALGMMLLGLLLAAFRPLYLDAIPTSELPASAAAAVYDTLVGFIRTNVRGILLLALLIAVGLWVSGPSTAARETRSFVARTVATMRSARGGGFATGKLGQVLWTYRTVVRIALVGLAGLILLFNTPITGKLVALVVVSAGVVWLIAELLASPPPESIESAGPDVSSASTTASGSDNVA